MSNNNSVTKVFTVAGALCVVCSILVTTAAVSLKPLQEANQIRDKQKNILEAAGVDTKGKNIGELFKQAIQTKYVVLEDGSQKEAPKDPKMTSIAAAKIPAESIIIEDDIAGIKRRAKWGEVYMYTEGGKVKNYILPIRGKGLWSTLYGFLALESDLDTVAGITFYQHGETPGLGGEIDNPSWKAKWKGKKLFDDSGKIKLEVIKGTVTDATPSKDYKVDGLAGATITARGVSNLVRYWLGESGYGNYLEKVKGGANG